jgi:phosphonate transport system substrate-binding protein
MHKRSFIRGLSAVALGATPLWVAAQSTAPVVASSAAKPAPKPRPKGKPVAAPTKIVFGLITPRNAEQTLKTWTPFLEAMSKSIGVVIEPKTYAQADLVTDFKLGKIDFAYVGNAPALEIIESQNGAVFAQMVVKGRYAYRSLFITHKDSSLRSLTDILASNGKYVFGDGETKSTSGHIVPRYFAFAKKGVNDVDALFKEVKRGSHVDNINRTVKKEVDFAATNTTELEAFQAKNPELGKEVRIIWESPDIPETPLVWRTALPLDFRRKVQNFVVNYGKNDEEKAILMGMNELTNFRKSTNAQLVNIADIEGYNARQRLINDKTLSPEERDSKINEVLKRSSKLEFQLKQIAVK